MPMTNLSKEDKVGFIRYTKQGRAFGYPDCCITSFIARAKMILAMDEDEFQEWAKTDNPKLAGTGYIPCAKCNNKTEEELIEAINQLRLIEELFKVKAIA